jgi:hypothetical protein
LGVIPSLLANRSLDNPEKLIYEFFSPEKNTQHQIEE